nr:Protein GLB-29, isoform d [Haemonchus contortus]
MSAKYHGSSESSTAKSLHRRRPNSIHSRPPDDLPMVNVLDTAPSHTMSDRPSEDRGHKKTRGHQLTRQDCNTEEQLNHHSRSISPLPHSRKELTISVTGRTWKSEDVYGERSRAAAAAEQTMPNASTLCLRTNGMEQQLSVDASTSSHETSPKRPPQLVLSSKHKKILRSTFAQMNSGGTFLKLMEQVFRRLEAKYPDIRSIFLTTAFVNSLSREKVSPSVVRTEHDHSKCLVSMFESIMDSLNDTSTQPNTTASIRTYGEKHAQMKESGMSGSMIEHFGEISVAVIASQDAIKYNHDAVKAWRLLLAYVTDEMMVGFDRSSRISERKCSANICLRRT